MKTWNPCPEHIVAGASKHVRPVRNGDARGHLRECKSCRRDLSVALAFKREFVACPGVEEFAYRAAAVVVAETEVRRERGPRYRC
jgi:hypothetical protein